MTSNNKSNKTKIPFPEIEDFTPSESLLKQYNFLCESSKHPELVQRYFTLQLQFVFYQFSEEPKEEAIYNAACAQLPLAHDRVVNSLSKEIREKIFAA